MDTLWLGGVLACLVMVITSVTSDRDPLCSQPMVVGVCRGRFPTWYFDGVRCSEFIYGGCGGNENRFDTKEACMRVCQSDVCLEPPIVGPCRAQIRLWYYDSSNRICNQFVYGGCDGNDNKFGTRERCEVACAGANLPCPLGEDFHTVGEKAVHQNYRDKEWLVYDCEERCTEFCLADHPWGICLSFSNRKRWYGCNCYLYDRFLSVHEFDDDTKGITRNRMCAAEPTAQP